ncbi:MAG TPA: 4-(cytidine 5'-diphospho)-2-C-methyl-D-erythritol kinase [Bacteroidales bacterium]|nr:4-(cytidine 5'-diphospho)-2-C-methyl-D-erythritol kinase [Bacteroidales bacterium]
MLLFPNAKINAGLHIIRKRQDGYHDLETLFLPIGLNDILEFLPQKDVSEGFSLTLTGTTFLCPTKENICYKAWALLEKEYNLPPLKIHLHKNIPNGAGLGGGSSDAAFLLKGLNSYFNLNIPDDRLIEYAARLGSDCAFFIRNIPSLATGRGEILQQVTIKPSCRHIAIVKPPASVSTAEAYSLVKPAVPKKSIREIIKLPVERWKQQLVNDFEVSVFAAHPELKELKETLYNSGASYAAMSGSGSAIYGIFRQPPALPQLPDDYFVWKGMLK